MRTSTETSRRQRHKGHEDRKDHKENILSVFVIFVALVIFVPPPLARLTADCVVPVASPPIGNRQ